MTKERFKKINRFIYGLSNLWIVVSAIGLLFFSIFSIFPKLFDKINLNLSIELPGISFILKEVSEINSYYFLILTLNILIFLLLGIFFRKIFKNIKDEKIFIKENFNYLKSIGLLTIASTIPYTMFNYNNAKIILENLKFHTSDFSLNIKLNFELVILGIIIIIFAEIFKYAVELREENDLTI